MKILKETGSYLEEQAKTEEINTSTVLFVIGIILGVSINIFLGVLIIAVALIYNAGFLIDFSNYRSGIEGENLVAEMLSNLDDKYYLINDIRLPEGYGNIDHIVFGPNGIFVIEIKNYSGKLICNGDEWTRYYEGGLTISARGRPYWKDDKSYDLGSPSKQVKRNSVKLKQLIESSRILKELLNIWVDGIVVFTNPSVDLQLTDNTVPILKIDELCDYIKNKKSKITFSQQELILIGKAVLRAG